MFKAILLIGVASVGLTAGALVASAESAAPVEVSLSAMPVFPAAKVAKVDAPSVPPAGAEYRVRSGKSGFKYVACDRQRAFGSAVEFGCLSWSKTKGWGKSIRWYPKYQLGGLSGELPAAPAEVASK